MKHVPHGQAVPAGMTAAPIRRADGELAHHVAHSTMATTDSSVINAEGYRSWFGVIYGEPASKANGRRLVRFGNRPASIKSKKALDFVAAVQRQTPLLVPLMTGPLRITATIYYASRRPDLDESALLDALQGRIYANDRAVVTKTVTKAIDRTNPRTEITVEEIRG